MAAKDLWSRTGVSVAGQIATLLLGFATSIPLARGLGPSGKGQYAFFAWGVGVAVLSLGWGWHNAVTVVVSKQPEISAQAVRRSRRALLPGAVFLAVTSALCAAFGAEGWSWVAATAAVQVWNLPAAGALIGAGRFAAYYGGLVAQGSVSLIGLMILWRGPLVLSPERAIGVLFIASLAALGLHSRFADAGLRHALATEGAMPQLSQIARNAWLAGIAGFVTLRLDFLFVRFFSGAHGLGLYSTATGVAELGRFIPSAVALASIRSLGGARGAHRRAAAANAYRLALSTSVLAAGALATISYWAIPAFYGEPFAPAATLVAWLAPGVALLAVASVSAAWLNVSGRSATTAKLSWLAAAFSVALDLVLIPPFGAVGAAAASSASYITFSLVSWKVASR